MMKIQVSNNGNQTIKSNSKRLVFFNIEDLKFQKSVLDSGIEYIKSKQFKVRTNKDYNSLERRKERLSKVKLSIEKQIKKMK